MSHRKRDFWIILSVGRSCVLASVCCVHWRADRDSSSCSLTEVDRELILMICQDSTLLYQVMSQYIVPETVAISDIIDIFRHFQFNDTDIMMTG